MTDTETTHQAELLRRARAGVFGIFWVNGFLLGLWVVHIPAIESKIGISHSTLGTLLLLLACGAIGGMQVSGPLTDRFGSRTLVFAAAVLLSVAAVGPGVATQAWHLGLALVLFGFANGSLDVAMNTQAVEVERRYRRPIMSAFHALFSIGGVSGSVVGAATLGVGVGPAPTLACSAIAGIIATTAFTRLLLVRREPAHRAEPAEQAHGRFSARVLALGALAFVLMLSEGVANDWSTLQVKDHLGTNDSTAALAFGAFSLTMTLGRLTADRVAGALGPVAIVRYGALIAATGLILIITSSEIFITLTGWALFGIGLSGTVPQIFTTAGNLGSGSAGTNMSRVVGLGYLGFLAGPAIIGWVTIAVPLTVAMVVPLVCVLAAAAGAGTVRRTAIHSDVDHSSVSLSVQDLDG
ncbi:MFS transporter [Rhodococcus sp. NPDC058521]|uniref:MFS transporter n=1 Tax=Rhodococcus sp. NPDC058521 TaxID=3346536 RepID=UPI00366245EC